MAETIRPETGEIPQGGQVESEGVNFHELYENRKALRRADSDTNNPTLKRLFKKTLDGYGAQVKEGFKKEAFGDSRRRKLELKRQKKEYEERALRESQAIDYDSIKESFPEVIPVKETADDLRNDIDAQMEITFKVTDPRSTTAVRETHNGILDTLKKEIDSKKQNLNNTEVGTLRAAELIKYKEELGMSGHICITPKTERELEAIGQSMLTGKPVFLHGPTGTGKTSLAEFAAFRYTGKNAEMVYCNPQTRESNVWGKTGLEPVGDKGAMRTVDVYGPLARAMRDGKVVIFDEFTALPREQMVFIKGVFGKKVGDNVPVVGNGSVTIAPGFQMIFTANLKSEKNPERQDLPPELAREFEQNNIEIHYSSPSEAYDIMRARLMNRDGSLDMSLHDLNVTLPNLCRVMADIQESYVNETNKDVAKLAGAEDSSGKVHSLKKFVMTQGSIEAMLSYWHIEKELGRRNWSFVEFLDERFKTALTFREYPKEDRILVAKMLASKGFLRTLTAKDLGLTEDVFDFDIARQMRGDDVVKELKAKSADVKHFSLKEVVAIDPFSIKQQIMRERVNSLLGNGGTEGEGGGEEGEESMTDAFIREQRKKLLEIGFGNAESDPAQINARYGDFLKSTFKALGINDQKIKDVILQPKVVDPKTQDYKALEKDTIPTRLGEYTINEDTQNIDWESVKGKIFIPDLSAFEGKPIHEVMKHVMDTYSGRYRFPGLEYLKFMFENPDEVPTTKKANLKDGNYYFTPGSLVRGSRGLWSVPCVRWDVTGWNRGAYWLSNSWNSFSRIVLLEI